MDLRAVLYCRAPAEPGVASIATRKPVISSISLPLWPLFVLQFQKLVVEYGDAANQVLQFAPSETKRLPVSHDLGKFDRARAEAQRSRWRQCPKRLPDRLKVGIGIHATAQDEIGRAHV